MTINSDKLVRTFLKLVQIDAVSLRERPVVDFLRARMDELGLFWIEDDGAVPYGGDAGNLIVQTHPGHEPVLFFCAHTDTVRPTHDLVPRIEDGIIRSSGDTILGADNRAGCAILLTVLEQIAAHPQQYPPAEFIFTFAEELGLYGAAALKPEHLRAREGYVLDSSRPPGQYVAQTPSFAALDIEMIGKPAHAGVEPELGINALNMAVDFLRDFPTGRINDNTVANIGVIAGGEASNVVPGTISMKGEIRSFDMQELKQRVRAAADRAAEVAQRHGGSMRFKDKIEFEGFTIEPDEPVCTRLHAAMRALNLEPEPQVYSGGSDANIFNARGRRAINIGIGAKKPHSNEEHIAIADMEIITRLVLELLAGTR